MSVRCAENRCQVGVAGIEDVPQKAGIGVGVGTGLYDLAVGRDFAGDDGGRVLCGDRFSSET